MPRAKASPPAIEMKGINLPAMRAALRSADLETLALYLRNTLGDATDFFSGDLTVIDGELLPADAPLPDWGDLKALLASYGLHAVAVRNVDQAAAEAARRVGLTVLEAEPARRSETQATPATEPVAEVPAAPAPPQNGPPSLVVDRPLRSGQQVYARGRDLILLGMVNAGAEVIADGSIHCYAPLRGRALAGARGDTGARILTTCFEAELVSVAGVYRSIDADQLTTLGRHPVQVKLAEGGQTLSIQPLNIG